MDRKTNIYSSLNASQMADNNKEYLDDNSINYHRTGSNNVSIPNIRLNENSRMSRRGSESRAHSKNT